MLILRDHKTALDLWLAQTTVDDELLHFEKALPIPDSVEDETEWCVNNWGCKWAPEDAVLEYEEVNGLMEYRIEFLTPWTPPIEAIEQLMDRQPLIYAELNWIEVGMDTAGWYVWEKGKVTRQFEGDSTVEGYEAWALEKFGMDVEGDMNHED